MARGGEHIAQDLCDPLRFGVDLLFAEPENLKSPRAEIEIPAPVIAKGLAAPVIAIAIGLDDKPALAPEKVDQVAGGANVDLGQRQFKTPADPQEVPLQIAARAIAACVLTERQAEHVSLTNRAPQFLHRDGVPKVGDRSRGVCHWDTPATGYLVPQVRRATMQPDPPAALSASITRNRNVNRPIPPVQQPPNDSGASVADDCLIATGKGSRHPNAIRRNRCMTDGIDALVNPVQSPEAHAPGNAVPAQASFQQLADGHHAVLANGNSGDLQVGTGAFVAHTAIKAPAPKILPPAELKAQAILGGRPMRMMWRCRTHPPRRGRSRTG